MIKYSIDWNDFPIELYQPHLDHLRAHRPLFYHWSSVTQQVHFVNSRLYLKTALTESNACGVADWTIKDMFASDVEHKLACDFKLLSGLPKHSCI